GYRIELTEIEAVLTGHESVDQCVVVMRDDHHGEKQLLACVVTRPQAEFRATALRDYLKERLPEYMVPVVINFDSLPLTPNGKIDVKSLKIPSLESSERESVIRTPTQELLAGIWAEVLQLPGVGIEDNFFSLGGH